MSDWRVSRYREITQARMGEFLSKGYRRRDFFPHRIYHLPKCGPDGYKLASRMLGQCDPNQLWEIVIYATPPVIDEFPPELFFDNDLIWHQQHFGRIGQVAAVDLVQDGSRLYSMAHQSDLVQRISRRRAYKTRIEKVFHGWSYMLLNSIFNFAREHNCTAVYIPTPDLAIKHTDRKRVVGRELFEQVYDRHVRRLVTAGQDNGWWVIDSQEYHNHIVRPETKEEKLNHDKIICVCHDIERGWGHREVDPEFARLTDETSRQNLDVMLDREATADVRATYNILGILMAEVRLRIEQNGHSIAFHSYDHEIETGGRLHNLISKLSRRGRRRPGQLARCREVDYRIRGYRPPRSTITEELSDRNLCFYNFEWLASSASSLQAISPCVENRLVKIPIAFDDFAIYKRNVSYEDWEADALERIRGSEFVAFSMHDCYSHLWLPQYWDFLVKLRDFGELKTLDDVANDLILSNAQ